MGAAPGRSVLGQVEKGREIRRVQGRPVMTAVMMKPATNSEATRENKGDSHGLDVFLPPQGLERPPVKLSYNKSLAVLMRGKLTGILGACRSGLTHLLRLSSSSP